VVCAYELVLQVKIFCLVIGIMEEQKVTIKFCVKAGKSAVETIKLINKAYEVWQKSNATGNAVHEPTTLLPPPSHGS
jgi:lipopolysaccharide biosynthesis glycosyltransferase